MTTKGEREAHGFGLAGMEEIARRRGGSPGGKGEGGRFQLTVCLPPGWETEPLGTGGDRRRG